MADNSKEGRFELAMELGLLAGEETFKHFQSSNLNIETKIDQTFVTDADRSAERLLRERIQQRFPRDSIVGEEYGEHRGTSGWTWYLDPIDGTHAFVHGVPLFGTLIGVERDEISEVGVICLPALGEMVSAGRGMGCWWRRQMERQSDGRLTGGLNTRAAVSKTPSLDQALFCTTWMQSFKESGQVDVFLRLCDSTRVFRGWGDCYGYALVATGRADIMVDPILMIWDAAPMLVILEEAGGRYTTFAGTPTIHGPNGVGTNGILQNQVIDLINKKQHGDHCLNDDSTARPKN